MATLKQRRQGTPVLVGSSPTAKTATVTLQRRPFQRDDIDEGWLQGLLHEHPGLLAVEEIEPDYAPLIPIGREVSTESGPIDNLFINPSGLLTIVEAKLWKNPDARREVVAQILDYAEQVSRWSYEDLNRRARASTGRALWEHIVASTDPDARLDEDEFSDAVSRNLRRGRFLLLIVGDGIKESVEQLTEYVHRSPSLRFHLALVEMRVYDMPNGGGLLVVPAIVARTQEIVRAVVELRDAGTPVDVSAPEPETNGERRVGARTKIDDEAFFGSIHAALGTRGVQATEAFLDAAARRGLIISAQTATRMVKVRDPGGSGKLFTLFGIHKGGTLLVGWLAGQTTEAGIAFEGSPAQTYLRSVSDLFGVTLVADKVSVAPEFWRKKPTVVQAHARIDEFFRELDSYLEAIGHSGSSLS